MDQTFGSFCSSKAAPIPKEEEGTNADPEWPEPLQIMWITQLDTISIQLKEDHFHPIRYEGANL